MENRVEFDELGFTAAREHGKSAPTSLTKAVEQLKEESTDEEYENLIKMMFDKLDRKGQRSLISKDKKFSSQVSKALFKSKK